MKMYIVQMLTGMLAFSGCVALIAQQPVDQSFSAIPGNGQGTPRTSVDNSSDYSKLHRIKDIAFYQGERDNVVQGIGLVYGLAGTGGRAQQTRILADNFFKREGVFPGRVETKGLSAVLVTGIITPDKRAGEKIIVTVAVADDATSLYGGVLARTMLRGIDGQIYAEASGPLIAGGVSAGGAAASVQRDHPTVADAHANVEREIHCDPVVINNQIRLIVRNKDHSTAVSVANAINQVFDRVTAQAVDSGTIAVFLPHFYRSRVPEFQSIIGSLRVRVDQPARVVINQKTGTIVIGQNVRISDVVFSNESLIISKAETPIASQPAPFSDGDTVVLPRSSVDIVETGGTYNRFSSGTTVGELATALNQLGVSPNLLIRVFTSLERNGALQGELVIQ